MHGAECRFLARGAERELMEIRLSDQNRTRVAEALHDNRISLRDMTGPNLRRSRRRLAGDIYEIFDRDRDSVQWTSIDSSPAFVVDGMSGGTRPGFVDENERVCPRPMFGRWNYLERFDYWAPFWGLTIVGGSGIMLWFKEVTASVWPGWIFNVAALAHGEEAFLAIVFLFTVHFFNNHFRPDKLPPPDIVMFTGAVSLEEFKREHTLEFNELVASGRLKDYLVDVPSPAMKLGARILGIVLLACGLTLLTLVIAGFVHTLST